MVVQCKSMQVILFRYFQVTSLGLAGGATMKDAVRGILKRAMRNDLALKVTWSGVNGKLAFERLHLKAVVVGKFNNCIIAFNEAFRGYSRFSKSVCFVSVYMLLLLEAVRRNPACSSATDNEIAKAIKKWLYWAGDRDGGRRKRQDLARTKPAPSQNPASTQPGAH